MELFNDELYKIKSDDKFIVRTYSTKMSMAEAKKYYTALDSAIDSTKMILPIKEWQLRKGKLYELVPRYENSQIRVEDLIKLVTTFNKKGYTNTDIKQQNLGYYKDKLVFIKYQGIHKIKKNETLKDVEFLRQTLVDLIFHEKGSYSSILKRHQHEEEYEKLPKMIDSGSFNQIYKQFVRQEYLDDETFQNTTTTLIKTPAVKPIDFYTQTIIKQSPWIDPLVYPLINPVYTPVPMPVAQPIIQPPAPEIGVKPLNPDLNPNLPMPYGGAKDGGSKNEVTGGATQSERLLAGAKTTNRKKPKDSVKESRLNEDFDHKIYKEFGKPFFLTNGVDSIIFNSEKEYGEKPFDSTPKESKPSSLSEESDNENPFDDMFIPGLTLEKKQEVKTVQYHKWHSKFLINCLFPDYGFILFLASYYGYDTSAFKIENRTDSTVEYSIVKEPQVIDKIKQDQLFQEFVEAQDLFWKFCPRVEIIPSILNRVLKVYNIDNYITNYKEIFDGTVSAGGSVMMCQYNENFKGSSNFIPKNFSIFPYLGNNTIGFLCQDINQIQCQIIQYNKLYIIDIYQENPKIIELQPDYQLPIKIGHVEKKVYQFIIGFKEVENFISNFAFLNPRKQSNTQFYFTICGKQLSLILRHKSIQCSGYFENKWESAVFFTLVKNIGGFEVAQRQQPTLQNLQMIQPLYFGKTQISDYEKQLESMDKRPSVSFIQQFQKKDLPKYLQDYAEESLSGGVKPQRKQQITIYNKEVPDKKFLDYQERFTQTGINIKTREQNSYLSDKRNIYMNFVCPKEYPYLNPTYLNSYNKNDIVYIGCQQTPIKFNGINLYELYEAYKNVLQEDDEFLQYLRKALFGRILINTIKFSSFTFISEGRCVQLLEELSQYFPSNLIMLKMVTLRNKKIDREWLESVCFQTPLHKNIIYYVYTKKIFIVSKVDDSDKYFVVISYNNPYYQIAQSNQYLLIQPDLYNNKYQPFIYENEIVNEQKILGELCQNMDYVKTENGVFPIQLFENYLLIKDNKLQDDWPTQKAVEKYVNQEDIQNYIIDPDKNLIGYRVKNGYNVYFKKTGIGKISEGIILGTYPSTDYVHQKNELNLVKFYPTVQEIAQVLIVNNRQVFLKYALKDFSKITKELSYQSTKDEQPWLKYGNIIYFMKAPMTEKQVNEALDYIKQYLPDNQEQIESYIVNVSCYFKYSLEFNYSQTTEQVIQLSNYQQSVDEIFFQ